jgi:hypothetical protein
MAIPENFAALSQQELAAVEQNQQGGAGGVVPFAAVAVAGRDNDMSQSQQYEVKNTT